ncbi:Lrp/AsnC family transcriptional regulator [Martelella mediterranea]|uniref:AsnC family transcriptional regulator n=1 Tax=Martelella mediterranea TaxID=293089 RepID=A0A4R3NME0_9HYPH|nr:Lrp/AsnC family transcriptional regulator [Martelella mediterranea]TCT36445.1 AsnC family transcriptional regulator [Martelella mediterranea]
MDQKDRKILALLADNADRSFVELGEKVALSPPAVHERVKRLKRDGVITKTVACLDGALIGCPLLAFIHVDTDSWRQQSMLEAFQQVADVEEIHSVAGETGYILKARTRDTSELEALLKRLQAIDGVLRTRSHIVLNTALERGPSPDPERGWN